MSALKWQCPAARKPLYAASFAKIEYPAEVCIGVRITDTLTKKERSKRMSLIRGRDTKPEMLVRLLFHRLGYRYRLHCSDLPGRPDLVFRPRRKVLFVHGCYWYCHAGCRLASTPKTNVEILESKVPRQRGKRPSEASRIRGTWLGCDRGLAM